MSIGLRLVSEREAPVVDLIDLGLGVVESTDQVHGGDDRYSAMAGRSELREAIGFQHKLSIDQICVSAGASMGLSASLASIDQKGEILCPKPYYPAYPSLINAFGHRPVFYDVGHNTDWLPDLDQIRRSLNSNSRAIIINNPGNPTGRLIPAAHLQDLAVAINGYEIMVISDEAGAEFVFDGASYPDASLSFSPKHLVQIRSFAKAFAIPGLRLGYMISNQQRIAELTRAHWSLTLGASNYAQHHLCRVLASEGWSRPSRILPSLTAKRSLVHNALDTHYFKPEAGIFAWVGAPFVENRSFSEFLLENYAVKVMPGACFGAPNFSRISFGGSFSQLSVGLSRIAMARKDFAGTSNKYNLPPLLDNPII